MKIVDCLKVLSILQSNQSINLGEIAKNTDLSQKEVKEAIKYLNDSALISENNGAIQVNVVKLGINN
ncbi:MAG: helix-turn-helix domain-containing protein [Candidatus Diapherotrites archaeon]|nr:helix-turn-helix domain-containing protein [Candidatus Diapherotrites archaeon]